MKFIVCSISNTYSGEVLPVRRCAGLHESDVQRAGVGDDAELAGGAGHGPAPVRHQGAHRELRTAHAHVLRPRHLPTRPRRRHRPLQRSPSCQHHREHRHQIIVTGS